MQTETAHQRCYRSLQGGEDAEFIFFNEGAHLGQVNMARDAQLLIDAERGFVGCRVYGWSGPWVSLGMNQDPDKALRVSCDIPWVVRPTGGKAVLHGHDVTVAIGVPLSAISRVLGEELDAKSVAKVYRFLARPLISALRSGGVDAFLGEETEQLRAEGRSSDCFMHVSPNDIVDAGSGKKVCGCALRLTDTAVLLQASIPCRRPLVDPEMVFEEAHEGFFIKLDANAFQNALESTMRETFGFAG
ncbi:MAG: hypothetical protein KF784_10385 [Fimbriimonadaceae bacterium]|nr:hypothetical protein [Fimbriimonadaceae bacterium]